MSTTDTERDERLRGIQERAEAATEGPWEVSGVDDVVQPAPFDLHRFDTMDLAIASAHESKADAAFIAAARTDVPWLLDEVARLDAVVTAVREVHDEHEDSAPNAMIAALNEALDGVDSQR